MANRGPKGEEKLSSADEMKQEFPSASYEGSSSPRKGRGKMEEPNRCEVEMDLAQVSHNERPTGSWLCCLPCYWLKRNSGFHKMSLTVVTLLVTVLLVASPVLFLISSIPGEKAKSCAHEGEECSGSESERKVCGTEECSKAGSRMLASMSWKANPCEDFYRFACGLWEERAKDAERPGQVQAKFQQEHFINFVTLQQQVDRNIQELLTDAVNSEPFQKVGVFYNSCLREATKRTSLEPMTSLLEELGGYVGPKEYPAEDLTDLILNLLRLNGAPLFDIYLDTDHQNSSEWTPVIDLPFGGGFRFASTHWWHRIMTPTGHKPPPERKTPAADVQVSQFLRNNPSSTDPQETGDRNAMARDDSRVYEFIKASIEEKRLLLMEKIMRAFMPRNMSSETRLADIQLTLHFANVLTKVYPREKEIIKNYQRETNTKMTVGELERKLPFIRWQYLLEKYLKVRVSPQERVFVSSPDYLDGLQRILHRFPSRVVHNGLLLVFATDTLYELVNASSARDWPAFCSKVTVNTFADAVSILYVRQFGRQYIEDLRERVTRVFDSLKNTFERRIEKASWLDRQTKEAAFEKVAALRIQFLSSSKYWNATYASSLMNQVHVHPGRFFDNVIQRYRQLRNVPLTPYRDHFDEQRWAYPFVVNAFYVLTLNTIIIPLALLVHPNFSQDVPSYIPYSTVGLIIAHEMLHGFDLKGIGYDSRGHAKSFMSQDSRLKFEARIDCFVKQFSSSFWRKVHLLGTNVDVQFDWNITKNENMADISGLQLAHEAWRGLSETAIEPSLPGVSLNSRQLFFLNAAQTYCSMLSPADYVFLVEVDFHTPQPERVNGIMMNSLAFAEAYQCPLGSAMNPRRKCSTW